MCWSYENQYMIHSSIKWIKSGFTPFYVKEIIKFKHNYKIKFKSQQVKNNKFSPATGKMSFNLNFLVFFRFKFVLKASIAWTRLIIRPFFPNTESTYENSRFENRLFVSLKVLKNQYELKRKIIPSIFRRRLKRAIEVASIRIFFVRGVLWTNSWPTLSLLTSNYYRKCERFFGCHIVNNKYKRWTLSGVVPQWSNQNRDGVVYRTICIRNYSNGR